MQKSERSEVHMAVPFRHFRGGKRAQQCFICREWTWDVCKSMNDVDLCLPCYVDVLEVRQARGVMGEVESSEKGQAAPKGTPTIPGNSPSPLDLFD